MAPVISVVGHASSVRRRAAGAASGRSSWDWQVPGCAPARAAHTGLMSQHTELGAALRAWRDRLAPADGGPARPGARRRAAACAARNWRCSAGMSVDYVTRLEQGRASAPSVQVLTALARALRLTDAEREHLFVAGRASRVPGPGIMPAHLTPGVQRLLDQLSGTPVSVYDAGWTLLAWNPLWAALVGDPSGSRGRDRNVLWRHFTGGPGRVIHTAGGRAAVRGLGRGRPAGARPPGIPGTRGCGGWWLTCAPPAPGSRGCGTAVRSAPMSGTARPCIIPNSGRSPWTVTCSACPPSICGWSRSRPRRAAPTRTS